MSKEEALENNKLLDKIATDLSEFTKGTSVYDHTSYTEALCAMHSLALLEMTMTTLLMVMGNIVKGMRENEWFVAADKLFEKKTGVAGGFTNPFDAALTAEHAPILLDIANLITEASEGKENELWEFLPDTEFREDLN